MTVYEKELQKLIENLGISHGKYRVFFDFVELSAIAINNSIEFNEQKKADYEKQYSATLGKYKKDDQYVFPQMFAKLVCAMEQYAKEQAPQDVLGGIYEQLELQNESAGQFFTPQTVCDFMSKILINNNNLTHDFETVLEPCCGSGRMIYSFAKAIAEIGKNYCKEILVTAVDIDIMCVYMTYLQLSLYGIPAVVIHGNTLENKVWSEWHTPIYKMCGWQWKKQRRIEINKPKFDIQLNLMENGQFSFI